MGERPWEEQPSMDGFGMGQQVRGVPYDPLQNKGELLLSQQREMLDALKQQAFTREPTNSLDYSGVISPHIEVLPPEVHFNTDE